MWVEQLGAHGVVGAGSFEEAESSGCLLIQHAANMSFILSPKKDVTLLTV